MKNFTNNFKQFTSRLSARWLIMTLMLLVGTSSAWADGSAAGPKSVYLNVNGTKTWYGVFNDNGWGYSPTCTNWNKFKNASLIGTDVKDFGTVTTFELGGYALIGWTDNSDWVAGELRYQINSGNYVYFKVGNWDTGSSAKDVVCSSGNDRAVGINNQAVNLLNGLNPGSHTIKFMPAGKLMYNGGSWNYKSHAEVSATFTVPGYSTTTGTLDIGEVNIGSNDSGTKTMTHYGFTTTATHAISGTNASEFSVTECSATSIIVKFTPTSVGDKKATITITDAYSKTYTLTVTGSGKQACEEPTSVSISRGDPTTGNICQGSKIDLTANIDGGSGDITYSWTKVSGTNWSVSANSTKQTCTVTAGTGSAEFKVTATRCGTPKTNTITLTADAKPAITLKSAPTICNGTIVTFANYVNTHTGTVTWHTKSDFSDAAITSAKPNATTTYYAKATNGVCSTPATASLKVTVSPQPAITLKAAPTICNGTTVTFANYVNTHTGTVTWHTDANCTSAAITTAQPSQTTTYYAKATSGDCTPAKASLKVTVNNKPDVPTLSADKTSLVSPDKETLTAGNTTNGLTYTLYNGETAGEYQTSTGGNLNFKVGEAGNYTVRVSNSCGTSTSDVVTITVCTPQTNEFRHANSSYVQQQVQPTYYPGDKAYFVSTINCCLTGTWSANLQKGEEAWYTGLKGGTPRFYMTLTRAGNFTITNMATNDCTQDRNVLVNLDFTVTALSEVTNASGTASGADIALTWKHSANHTKVMVVRYPTAGTETIPAGGQSYSAGNTLGEGTVVYVGTSESYTDKNLPAGASYKYYFYTVNNNYYSEGVVLNMSSCPTPAKPILSSTAITACDGEVTANGYITITNMADYKDDTYTFKLGDIPANLDANGKITISSAEYTEYTVKVINSCGNSNSTEVEIAINNITPTISGETFTQPGKANKILLTVPTGITAEWSVSPEADLSVSKGNSTMFSAETNGTYTITATNGTCSDTHVVTVADAFYIYFRNAKKGETAYANFYDPNQNTEEVQGGEMFYAECDALPTNGNNSLPTHFVNYNKGGRKADIISTDCDGYTWYGFKASAEVVAGTKYFYVHATNDKNYNGHYTHTVPTKKALNSDVYYTLGTTNHTTTYYGWNITLASAPYAGPKVHASGSTALGTNKFAALYVTDCSGKKVSSYQWEYCGTQAGPYDNYKASVSNSGTLYSGDAGTTNNIRPETFGWYRCKVTYEGGTPVTSEPVQVTGSYTHTSSTLPVIIVNTNGEGFPVNDCSGTPSKNADKMKEKVSVDVKIYDKEGKMVYDRKARMNYRGSSSLNFLKKSYAFCPGKDNCVEDKGRQDYVKTEKMNMLNVGTAKDKDWVLYAAAPDPSLMRNRLVFDTFRDMTGKWSVNSCYVQLYVDGTYKGVYVLMDKITNNKNRVDITHEDGFIVKFDKTDKVDRVGGYNGKIGDEKTFKTTRTGKDDIGTYDTSIDQRFEIEYPEKDDYPTGWSAKVNQIQGMFEAFENALAQGDFATVQKYIDYDSWADWFIISEYIKNVDAYRASNIFVYNGEKIEARPLWDQELSFNNQTNVAHKSNDATGLMATTGSIYNNGAGDFPAPFWFTGGGASITGGLLSDPCFVQVVKEKWNQYSTGTGALTQDALNKKIEAYTTELGTAADISFNRGTMDCGSCNTGCGANGTGYSNSINKSGSIDAMETWIEYRGNNLTTALNNLKGASFSIQIIPSEAKTTPWEPVEIAVSVTPAGYDYKLEYTDNDLGSVANTIIKEEGDKITYRIPRPSAWGAGDAEEGTRADIEYGIKATLSVQEGTTVCGSQAAPSSTGKIILQDEDNDNCK